MKITIKIRVITGYAMLLTSFAMLGNQTFAQAPAQDPIFAAVEAGNTELVKAIVTANPATVELHDRYGKTPLHYAVCGTHTDLVEFLLKQCASVTARDNRGWTALHHAAENGSSEVTEMLIHWNADVNAVNTMQWTALHQAVLRGHLKVAVCLVQHGADVFAETSRQATAYNIAVEHGHVGLRDYLVAQMEATRTVPSANSVARQ